MALSERLAIVLETVGAGTVVRDFNKVSSSAAKLGIDTKKTGGSLDSLAGKLGTTSAALGTGLAAAAAVGGAAVVASVKHFQSLAQATLTFQRASGATAEQSSALLAAMDDMGISADAGAKSIFQLGKRLETSAPKLAEYGVFAAKGANGNTDLAATLLNVSDAYLATADPAKRAALLTAAFGKQGRDLIPILEQGSAGIKGMFEEAGKHGQILNQDEIDKSEKFRLALDDLGDAVGKLGLELGGSLVPVLTTVAGWLTTIVGAADKVGHFLGEAFGQPERDIRAAGDAARDAGLSFEDSAARYRKWAEATVTAHEDNVEAVDSLRSTLFTATAAQRSYADAQRAVITATDQQKAAQRTLDDLLAKTAVDATAVARATREAASASHDLEQANNDLVTAQERVTNAQQDLNDLLSGKTGADAKEDATDDLARAKVRERRATAALAEAQDRLTTLQSSGTATSAELEDAQLDLEEAGFSVKDAFDAEAEAQRALNEAEHMSVEGSPEVVTARNALKTATTDLGTAQEHVTEATQDYSDKLGELSAANAGDPNFNEAVRLARQGVADATQHVADASHNASEKAFELTTKTGDLKTKLAEGGTAAADLRTQLANFATDPALKNFLGPQLAALAQLNKPSTMPSALGPGAKTTPDGSFSWVPRTDVAPTGYGGGLMGTAYNIVVQTLTGAGAGQAVVAAIKDYERASGTGWRTIP